MNEITAYSIVFGLFLAVILEFWFVFYWMNKNNILVQLSQYKDGVLLSGSRRCRLVKGKIYNFKDMIPMMKRKALKIDFEDFKDKFISAESIPILGVKRILKLKLVDGVLIAWTPSIIFTKTGIIKNTLISWTDSTRIELYENTKPELSQNEQLARIIVPMGLILLGMACLIFFPKIYASIMEHGNSIANTAINSFSSMLDRMIPIG